MRVRRLASLFTIAFVAAAGALACSSSSSGTTSGSGSNDPVCKALADYDSRCQLGAGCVGLTTGVCDAEARNLSDAARQAHIACFATASCDQGDAGASQRDACVRDRVMATPPNDAQRSVARAWCAACGNDAGLGISGSGVCEDDFFKAGGSLVLYLNDAKAQTVSKSCATSKSCDLLFSFPLCASLSLGISATSLVIGGSCHEGDGG